MELRHLRYFVAVAEDLNFSRAARRLRIAQPALSAQVRVLEDEVGVPLFHRSTRAVRLSAVGKEFLPKARDVLAAAAVAEETVRRAVRGEIGCLTLGFITSAGTPVFHEILTRFRARFPEVELRILDLPSGKQSVALAEGSLDVGIHRPPIDATRFESEIFSTDRMVLAIPAGHLLARRRRVPWTALVDEPVILLSRELNPAFHEAFTRECRRARVEPRVGQEANSVTTLLGLVSGGHGVAPVVDAVGSLRTPQVVLRPMDPAGPELTTALVWRRESPSPLALAFVGVARQVLRRR